MKSIENIVPSLELCRQIPEGVFADSVLVWVRLPSAGFEIWNRRAAVLGGVCRKYPAPTLAEVLAKLPNSVGSAPTRKFLVVFDTRNNDGRYQVGYGAISARSGKFLTHDRYRERDINPVNAALRLWLMLEGNLITEYK